MATITALKTGNWSDSTVWPGGVFPTGADVVRTGGFTVTIDQNITVSGLENIAAGSFLVNSSRTINGNITAGTGHGLDVNLSAGQTLTINGNVTGSNTTSSKYGINILTTSVGTVHITGTLTGGTASSGYVVCLVGNATVHIYGSIFGFSTAAVLASSGTLHVHNDLVYQAPATVPCINISTTANLIVDGDVINNASGSATGAVVNVQGANVVTINGSVRSNSSLLNTAGLAITGSGASVIVHGNVLSGSGNGSNGISLSGASSSVTVNGNVTGGGFSNAYGISNTSVNSSVTINGNVTAGLVGIGLVVTSTGNATVNGTSKASASVHGSLNNSTGYLWVMEAAGPDDLYVSTVPFAGVYGADVNGTTIVQKVRLGALGQCPTTGYVRFDNALPLQARTERRDGTSATLINLNDIAGELPAPADVRAGVGYNSNSKVGTMAVPAASDVRKGVLVDVSGVGTALITAEDMWNFPVEDCDIPGSIGERLAKAVSAELLGAIVQALSTKLPA